MIVLGIDPGTATTGYGVVRTDGYRLHCLEYGCVMTSKDMDAHQRLATIHDEISALIKRHAPQAVAFEQLFFSKNVTTALGVGQARGVMLLAAAQAGLEVAEYTPTTVKLAVTGYGAAGKDQVQTMIRSILALDKVPRPDDAADALAIAVCHHNSCGLQDRIRTAGSAEAMQDGLTRMMDPKHCAAPINPSVADLIARARPDSASL